MNKKIVPILLASSMVLQGVVLSFAEELNEKSSEKANQAVSQEIKADSEKTEKNGDSEKSKSKEADSEKSKSDKEESEKKKTDNEDSEVLDKSSEKTYSEFLDNKLDKSQANNFLNGEKLVERVNGNNRVETSVKISRFTVEKADKVILADASNYPDALSAATLTEGKYPVILVGNKVTDSIKGEIQRLGAKEVLLLGGVNSISKSVESELGNIGSVSSVKRISGSDRYSTSSEVFNKSGKKDVVVASGQNFPDALASAGLLNESGLLLTRKNSIPEKVAAEIKKSENDIKIIGGKGSVGTGFYKELGNKGYEVISGKDRYETSVRIADKLESDAVIIASGENFPDALAASTLSQKIKAPVLLVSKYRISDGVADYIRNRGIKKAVILGGENTIAPSTAENVEKLIKGEQIVNKVPLPALKKDAVAKDSITLYKTQEMKEEAGNIPKNKIVDVIEQNEDNAKIRYDKLEGWTSKTMLKNYNPVEVGKVVNNVPYISQVYPVYAPNGCEGTSMLMALQYKGYTKMGIKEFLQKMPKTKYNPKYGFVGDPMKVQAGYYQSIDPEPLAKYGRTYGNVVNIQGRPIQDVIKEIQNGNPVVMYATLQFRKPTYNTLTFDGKPTKLIWNTHVVLVTGYDPVNKKFLIADPYNPDVFSGNKKKPYFYWKTLATVDAAYNYNNRRFAVAIR